MTRAAPSPKSSHLEVGREVNARALLLVLMAGLAIIGLVEQLRLVQRFGRQLTNEDQALLWAAARDYGDLVFRQPNFWGQKYGTTFEAIPVALAHAFGVTPATALPVTLTLLGLLVWWVVALAAWRGGHPVLGIVAATAPVLLTTEGTLIGALYPPAVGRSLAGMALALVVAKFERAWVLGMFVCIGGFAIVFDASTAILVIPAATWLLLSRRWGWRALMRWGCLGAAPVVGWIVACSLFYRAHPDYDLHPPPLVDPSIDTLRQTLAHASEYFRIASPEVWRWWPLPVAAGVIALVLAVLSRQARCWLPAALAVLGVLGVLSTSKALDGFSTVYLRKERVLLLLPLVLWFLWFLVAESHKFDLHRGGLAVALAIGVLVLATVPIRATRLDDQLAALRTAALAPAQGVSAIPVSDIVTGCADVHDAARETGTRLAVFYATGGDRSLPYGCESLDEGAPDTLFPTYERRTWRLDEERGRRRKSMLVWHVDTAFCDRAAGQPGIVGCRVASARSGQPEYAVVRFVPRSALDVLREIGIESRPFGHDCHPRDPATCTVSG